jgi:hypothetical protein
MCNRRPLVFVLSLALSSLACAQLIPKQLQEDYNALATNWNATSKINDVSPLGVFGPSAFAVVENGIQGTGVAMAGVRI